MKRDWVIPLATGLFGVIAGALFQDAILPKILKNPLSDETVDIFIREDGDDLLTVFLINNSDDTLDVSQVEVAWKLLGGNSDLSAYIPQSKVFLIDGGDAKRFASINGEGGSLYLEIVSTRNSIPPHGRDALGVRFVDPALKDVSVEGIKLVTPNGVYLNSDGSY